MLDQISRHILRILQEKARIPNVEMARQIGMTPSGVLERVRKLEKQGYIDGYEVRLNPDKFGYPILAFIQLTLPDAAGTDAIVSELFNMPDILEIHTISGEDGLMLKVRATSIEGLNRLIYKQIASLTPGIRTRTSIVLTSHKETSHLPLDAAET